jgi:hypothetical protein
MKLTTVITIFLALIFNHAAFAQNVVNKTRVKTYLVYGKANANTISTACARAEVKARNKMNTKIAKRRQSLEHSEIKSCECEDDVYKEKKQKHVFQCQLNLEYKTLPLSFFEVVAPPAPPADEAVDNDGIDPDVPRL